MRLRPILLASVLCIAGSAFSAYAQVSSEPAGEIEDTATFVASDTVAAEPEVDAESIQAPLILAPISLDLLDFADAVPFGGYAAITPPAPKISTKIGNGFRMRSAGYASRPNSLGVNSTYGYRRDPITGGTRMHTGVDLKAGYGQTVGAAMGGVVAYAARRGGYGNLVVVDHGGGIFTFYGHLSGISVQYGQRVLAGQTVGNIGSTGRSTGPHLHYELRVRGIPVNPAAALTIDNGTVLADGRIVDGPVVDGGDETAELAVTNDGATTVRTKKRAVVVDRPAAALGDSLSNE